MKPVISDKTNKILTTVSSVGRLYPDPNVKAVAKTAEAGIFLGRHIYREYIKVKGHTRRTKKGKLVQVKPYLRRHGYKIKI